MTRTPPPPPTHVKRGHPDGERVPRAEAKRFKSHSEAGSQGIRPGSSSLVQTQAVFNAPPVNSTSVCTVRAQADVSVVPTVQNPASVLNTSLPFEPVRGRRRRNPPAVTVAGVTAIENPTRVTPSRQAKSRTRATAQPPPSPDAIEINDELSSPECDAMEGGSGDSSHAVVDWVIFL